LKPSAYIAPEGQPPLDFRNSPPDKTNWGRHIFGGFRRCLYSVLKFDSDTERQMAVILDREATRWFKPALGQFQIEYRLGADRRDYQPDFAAETESAMLLIETKARNAMNDPDVFAKRDAAVEWCRHASAYTASCGGKPWQYVLVPHDAVMANVTLELLVKQFGVHP
jgi:type III restriction enzyme